MRAAIGFEDHIAKKAVAFNHGHPLVELISVRALSRGGRRRPPCGTVSVFDGKRGQIVYHRRRDQAPSISTSHAEGVLLLTGPYRAISAEGSIAIELDLCDERDQEAALDSKHKAASSIRKIFWDVYSKNAAYDEPITKTVSTRYGPVEVKYIVWSNAAEGIVQVRLLRRNGADAGDCIHGRITAALSSFPGTAVTLFDCNNTCTMLREGDQQVSLAKSVIAAPLMQSLTVKVDLCGHSGLEIVSGSLEFLPNLDEKHVQSLVGVNGGEVEVTIRWSD